MPDSASPKPAALPLRWRRPRWVWLPGLTLGAIGLFHLITLQRQQQSELEPLLQGQPGLYLARVLGYYLPFELLSLLILLVCLGWYFRRCMPRQLTFTLPAVLGYEARFLPAVLGAILLLAPVTNSLRYLLFHYPTYSWAAYYPEWFFTGQMFSNYLVPVLLVGYGLLNGNLLLDLYAWQRPGPGPEPAPAPTMLDALPADDEQALTSADDHAGNKAADSAPEFCQHLTVFDGRGEAVLPVRELRYVEVAARKQYRAHDQQGRPYELRHTLSELEALLDPGQFLRLSRSVLINLSCVRSFAYWENDKYIVRLDDGQTELVMPRARLRELRTRLAALAAGPAAG